MDTQEKWLLKFTLTYEEALEIIMELYNGAKKRLNFHSNQRINKNLFKLYQDFNSLENSEITLNFSEDITQKPFITLELINNLKYSHRIITEDFTIYIYE